MGENGTSEEVAKGEVEKMVTLTCRDGEEFRVPLKVAQKSMTIKTMLEDLPEDDDDDEPIPLPKINAAVLRKIVEYCEFHKDDEPQAEDDEMKEKNTDIPEPWDQEFLKVDQCTLFELILAANYLDIKPLLDTACKCVANMIKGKTPEEIRKTFNIKNDFTPEEEEQIRKENEWCEDTD